VKKSNKSNANKKAATKTTNGDDDDWDMKLGTADDFFFVLFYI